MIEGLEGARAHRHERLTKQRELDDLDRPGRSARAVRLQRSHAVHAGIGEQGCVEGGGFVGLLRIPETAMILDIGSTPSKRRPPTSRLSLLHGQRDEMRVALAVGDDQQRRLLAARPSAP